MRRFTRPTLVIAALSAILIVFCMAIGTDAEYASPGIDSGDTAFVAFSAALVMLMTPALGFFYAGLVRKKNLLSMIVQSVTIFAVMTIVWALWGYSEAFGPSIGGLIGDLSHAGLKGVGGAPDPNYAPTIPALLFFFFQLKFAAITPALIIGAFAERIKFSTLLVFVVLWATFIYSPMAHWVWGSGGWLRGMGALDFAGGTVVHILAGFSALAAALVIGRRNGSNGSTRPNNVPFVFLGAALLWFGWFGFNGGSALAANSVAINALVTTNIAASSAALSWMAVDWMTKGYPTATGIAIGAVCGLVAITPAAGFVGPIASIVIGLVAGLVSNAVASWRLKKTNLDDTLNVFACHGVSGVWGALATGIFATTMVNPAGANGLLYGNPGLLAVQAVAVAVSATFAFVGSYVLLKILDRTIGLRVRKEAEEKGLDLAIHGEPAYDE
jgi:ammonium transporter, Amt family